MPTPERTRSVWAEQDLPEPPPYSFRNLIRMIGPGVILLSSSIGGTVERMLERASYFMMGFVFLFLLAVNVAFIPASHWWEPLAGFFRVRVFTVDVDWSLVAAFVATTYGLLVLFTLWAFIAVRMGDPVQQFKLLL